MITVATYRNLMSAELAKTRLESCEIKAVIADVFFYILGYGSIMEGVRLQVPEADAERAREILSGGEFIDSSYDNALIAESPETDAARAGTLNESAEDSSASRPGGRPVLLLLLSGIFCLILSLPAGDWRTTPPSAGLFFLLGVILIVAGLWILYSRLSADREHEQ
jgi:hypothetical protein